MKLQFKKIHVQIGSVKIVQGVSFRIEPGELAGVIGPNGSGKSILACCGWCAAKP